MHSIIASFLLLFASAIPAHASDSFIEFKLSSPDASYTDETYGLRYYKNSGRCEGYLVEDSNPPAWQKLPSTICTETVEEYKKRLKAIESDANISHGSVGAQRIPSTPHGFGTLRIDAISVPVEWNVERRCDATLTHCYSPELSAASELGKILREKVYAALISISGE